MNILIAPNSMKGSLSAIEFAEIVERAFLKEGVGSFKTLKVPVADGGDETGNIMIDALGLKKIYSNVRDPLGRNVSALWGLSGETAVIEMANASGMKLLKSEELNPLKNSSFGTGQLIKKAIESGARKIYLGVGGSATVDGGAGMLEAMGVRFFDKNNRLLQGNGENLNEISEIDVGKLNELKDIEIKIISDVTNPLLGEHGAAAVFGPQKGATPEMVKILEEGLANFENIIRQKTKIPVADIQGSGAAGGIAIGLVAFLNAEIVEGADFVLNILDFNKHAKWADVVITGEGKFDHQSMHGKAPAKVAQRAALYKKPVFAIVGINDFSEQTVFNKVFSLTDKDVSKQEAISGVKQLIYEKAFLIADALKKT